MQAKQQRARWRVEDKHVGIRYILKDMTLAKGTQDADQEYRKANQAMEGLGIQTDSKRGIKRAMTNFEKNICPTQEVTSYKLPVI